MEGLLSTGPIPSSYDDKDDDDDDRPPSVLHDDNGNDNDDSHPPGHRVFCKAQKSWSRESFWRRPTDTAGQVKWRQVALTPRWASTAGCWRTQQCFSCRKQMYGWHGGKKTRCWRVGPPKDTVLRHLVDYEFVSQQCRISYEIKKKITL